MTSPEPRHAEGPTAGTTPIAAALPDGTRIDTAATVPLTDLIGTQRDAFLPSPDRDPAWIAGWHAAVDHITATLAAHSAATATNPTDRVGNRRETATQPELGARVEWGVEVTWVDPARAGALGPTSQYGPFTSIRQVESFVDQQRIDEEIAATRVLARAAAYTDWAPLTESEPTTREDRAARKERLFEKLMAERDLRAAHEAP